MITKIQIKNRYTGGIIFEYECEDNSIRKTVEEAVMNKKNLYVADLRGANLDGANLHSANLKGADLRGADLDGVYLDEANLRGADLRGAYLRMADLRGADLKGANLGGANLYMADLRGADLYVADLREANLGGAKNVPYIPLECPSDGAFTGWKKVCGCIIELQIPADAKRSSATTRRCRCDKAKVISIKDEEGNDIEGIVNTNYTKTAYKVGGMVYPDSFDEDRFNECSHGIHFFVNKQDAIDY